MTALSLEQAQKIIAGALAHSKAKGYKPMGVAVLDDSGNLKAFARVIQHRHALSLIHI